MKEEPIDRLARPLSSFFQRETTPGLVLVLMVLVALVWANGWPDTYQSVLDTKFTVGFTNLSLTKSVHDWINDGLMTTFFFSTGLDIKQQVVGGQLATLKKASLPTIAALGGMLVPALIFTLLMHGKPGSNGWGIPMSTDIAFAVGLLSFVSKQVPAALRVFLTALAVVDDLGAVLVIAIFYTSDIITRDLGIALLFMGVMFAANYLGIRSHAFYFIVGILGLWYAILLSGVDATLAGVLAAIAIPTRTQIDEQEFTQTLQQLTTRFQNSPTNNSTFISDEQLAVIEDIQDTSEQAQTPLQRFSYYLSPLVSYLIMPVFALANAGIRIQGNLWDILTQPICYSIMAALLIGKFLGIVLSSRLLVALGVSELPQDSNWAQLAGMGLFGGIGFTMSLFITELALKDETLIRDAKVGILVASVLAASLAIAYFKLFIPQPSADAS